LYDPIRLRQLMDHLVANALSGVIALPSAPTAQTIASYKAMPPSDG
jgi:hypothetical protein